MARTSTTNGHLRSLLLLVVAVVLAATAGAAAAPTSVGLQPRTTTSPLDIVRGDVHQQVGHLPAIETKVAGRTASRLPLVSLLAILLSLGLGARPAVRRRLADAERGWSRRRAHVASAPLRGPPAPSHP